MNFYNPTVDMINVCWICKNDLFAYGIEKMLNNQKINLLAVLTKPEEAIDRLLEIQPDVVITDVNWKWREISGVDVIQKLQSVDPSIKIIGVTTSFEQDLIHKLQSLSIQGYFFKNDHPENMIRCIKKVSSGESSFTC